MSIGGPRARLPKINPGENGVLHSIIIAASSAGGVVQYDVFGPKSTSSHSSSTMFDSMTVSEYQLNRSLQIGSCPVFASSQDTAILIR